MAVAQFDLSPLEIFKDLRVRILSSTFVTIPATLQCLLMMGHQEGQKPFHYFLSSFAFTVNRQQIVIIALDTIALQWKF